MAKATSPGCRVEGPEHAAAGAPIGIGASGNRDAGAGTTAAWRPRPSPPSRRPGRTASSRALLGDGEIDGATDRSGVELLEAGLHRIGGTQHHRLGASWPDIVGEYPVGAEIDRRHRHGALARLIWKSLNEAQPTERQEAGDRRVG